MTTQQNLLRKEVMNVVDYINYMKKKTEIRLKSTIRGRVYEACQIAQNIREQNAASTPPDEIKKMIKDALRPIRFNNGRGYYFAFSLEGIEELFADQPSMEGRDMLPIQGAKGEYVVRDMIDLIGKQQEGFYRYTWSKPNRTDGHFPKIAFVKLFEPYGWGIGTGEYLDDVQSEIQNEVLERIVSLRFGNEGYFFGSVFGGEPLFTNGNITRGGASVWDLTDPNGVKIIQEQQKAAQSPSGGFIQYCWKKLDSSAPAPKIAFVMAIPEWEWVIGAGVYIDTIESKIAANERLLKRGLLEKITKSGIILSLLLIALYGWARYHANRIQKGIRLFSTFFEKAAAELSPMNPDALPFQEFDDIAASANRMLQDRKGMETILQESEERFRTLVEQAGDAIYFADYETGGFLDVNRAATSELGYSREELLTMSIFDIDGNRTEYAPLSRLWGELTPGRSITIESLHRRKDGSVFPVEIRMGLIEIRGRQGILGLARNITERKQLLQQLHQAHKMEAIGTLAGGIAHDFNNILGIILGNAELASDDIPDWNPTRSFLEEIRTASLRAKDVVRQLLSFSRKSEEKQKPIDILPIIRESLKLLRSTIPTNIEFRLNLPSECRAIMADPTQIHQIMINLCTNAAHAMEKEGGRMEITLSETRLTEEETQGEADILPGSYLRLTIHDTGQGIAPEFLDRIFDPYFTTKGVGKGSGMGLAVVHGIVKRHNGFIRVNSIVNQGTSLNIFLPAISAVPESEADVGNQDDLPKGMERILLVDDETAILKMIAQSLERLGYKVTAKSDPREALALFMNAPNQFDILLTDMAMPNMTGDVLVASIRAIRPNLPAILCTGHSERMNPEIAQGIGLSRFLMKPVNRKELSITLRELLDEIREKERATDDSI